MKGIINKICVKIFINIGFTTLPPLPLKFIKYSLEGGSIIGAFKNRW
jgi:hypothetical protein